MPFKNGGANDIEKKPEVSVTTKHRLFVSEPLTNKCITDVPGVGGTYADRLKEHGYVTAIMVYGQFLVFGRNEELFTEWFIQVSGGNTTLAKSCYQALDGWHRNFMK